jgi:3-dehydroquinate dehydratase II
MAQVLILNGPNLNLLGTREPSVYGTVPLSQIMESLKVLAGQAGHQLVAFQSNSEGALIDRIHAAAGNTAVILFNPAGFTHTSVVLRDALLAVNIPFIEVHLSNVHAREPFRRHSYFSDIAIGTVTGFGPASYELALHAALQRLNGAI